MAAAKKTPGVKRTTIKCPKCGGKSKVIDSMFGGFQTRQCSLGHFFEHDKWMDRFFSK
jgi:ssDNA-binding Zn-finger/Zn-ribbon topoisomerase 1